jgi:hypothetical protein
VASIMASATLATSVPGKRHLSCTSGQSCSLAAPDVRLERGLEKHKWCTYATANSRAWCASLSISLLSLVLATVSWVSLAVVTPRASSPSTHD